MAAKKKTMAKKRTAKKKSASRKVKLSMMTPDDAMDKKWQAEDDVRTLMRAEEIQKDKARMSMAQKVAKQQAAEASQVAAKLSKRK